MNELKLPSIRDTIAGQVTEVLIESPLERPYVSCFIIHSIQDEDITSFALELRNLRN